MLKRMALAGLLALAAVPALAASNAAKAPVSTDEARVLAGQQIIAQQKAEATAARACACKHG